MSDVARYMRIHAVALALSMVSLGAGNANAAAPWSAPSAFGTPTGYVQQPVLAFAANGNGLAGWDGQGLATSGGGTPPITGSVLRLTQGDGFGALRALPDTLVAGPALGADGRGLVLRSRTVAGGATAVSWSNVDAAGAVGAPHPLTTARLGAAPHLAVDSHGDALAGWTEATPPRSRRQFWDTLTVKVAWRPAGARSFGRPQTLFTTQAIDYDDPGDVVVSINNSGRALVAYADVHQTRHGLSSKVYAWPARRPGASFGPRLTAGPHDGFTHTAAVVDLLGRSTIVWGSQDGGEEANRPWVVRAASLAPGAKRFGAVQTLDDGGGAQERPQGGIALADDGAGHVLAAWSGIRSTPSGFVFPVQAATLDPATGRFGTPQQLAPDGAVGGAAARLRDGAAIVTFARIAVNETTDQALAAVRPAGAAAFGAPEALAPPDQALPPVVAFDPATGAPVAAWSARPDGASQSLGATATAVLRVATRDAP